MPFTGGVAESVVVDANYVFALPDSVSFATAAALPLNYLTAHFALVRRAKLQPGGTVLVQAGAAGRRQRVMQHGRSPWRKGHRRCVID